MPLGGYRIDLKGMKPLINAILSGLYKCLEKGQSLYDFIGIIPTIGRNPGENAR
jgi:hypothetical protein